MKFGLFGINTGACAAPATAAAVAKAAEAAGFESLWTGEHIVLPDPQAPPSPVPPSTPFVDSAIALSWAAANTRTIKLGTGIIIMPQRNPLILAKELASLDVISNGRLIFGIGIGYLKPEFEALGAPFDHKGERTEEFLAAMIGLWTMERPQFQGRFVSFSHINAMPRPRQKPYPEIVFGGNTPQAFNRAARLAKGWFGFAMPPDTAAKCIEGLRSACKTVGRRFEDLEISIAPRGRVDLEVVKRYAELGVHRLILLTRNENEADLLGFIDKAGGELVKSS